MLVYSDGQIVRPHSDLEVKLTGACGEHVGVVPTVGDSRAGIERLDSAYVDQIEVTLDGGYTALVDLTWEAEGPVRYEWIREPGTRAFHRTRSAPVTGSVTISLGGSELFTVTGDDEMGDARITRYSELHW